MEVRGWDVATKNALTYDRAGQRPPDRAADGQAPEALAKTFGDPTYVAADVPYRTQAEVDEAAKPLGRRTRASAFAEFEGIARGNPKLRAGAAVSASTGSASRSTESTRSPPRGTASIR